MEHLLAPAKSCPQNRVPAENSKGAQPSNAINPHHRFVLRLIHFPPPVWAKRFGKTGLFAAAEKTNAVQMLRIGSIGLKAI
jgi:hypothetical protein